MIEPDWTMAACSTADPKLFFPEAGQTHYAAQARRICRNFCSLTDACLEFALETGQEFGVWGGMTPDERRRLQQRRTA